MKDETLDCLGQREEQLWLPQRNSGGGGSFYYTRMSTPLLREWRSLCPGQQMQVTWDAGAGTYSDPLTITIEKLHFAEGEIHSLQGRIDQPSKLYPELCQGEPILLTPYQIRSVRVISPDGTKAER